MRLGFLANFLSHPVIAGFITASGILIATSQLQHILGISAGGPHLSNCCISLFEHLGETNWITLAIGRRPPLFLFWVRKGLMPLLRSGRPEADARRRARQGRAGGRRRVTTFVAWVLFDLGARRRGAGRRRASGPAAA